MAQGIAPRSLFSEWRAFFSKKHLKDDLIAGATVACIAVPLSLAIALASGVEPAIGLVTAIVGSVVVAFFGGTPLAVSGPAAAMAVLIASVVQRFGLGGLLVVGFGCGLLQLITGALKLGRLVRFVPVPVIEGFTAGIGAIILIGQLPRVFGLPAPDQAHVYTVLTHIFDLFHQVKWASFGVAIGTLALILGLPRVFPRVPASLLAVVVCSVIAILLGLPIETIGSIPSSLPLPRLPGMPEQGIALLLTTILSVYALASLETLLSSSAVDKIAKGQRHDPDQELVGQGLGNMAVSLFGGIPITGVIARSALNVQAGAKTRRAAIIHAIFLIGIVYLFSGWMSRIPIAVLAGVLLSVAWRMLNPRELMHLWKVSRSDAIVYGVTFMTIVAVDLIVGVQAGLGAALLIAVIKLGHTRALIHVSKEKEHCRMSIDGPLTFMSSSKIEMIRRLLNNAELDNGVIIDMNSVTTVDSSAAAMFLEIIDGLLDRDIRVVLRGVSPQVLRVLSSVDRHNRVEKLVAVHEGEVIRMLGRDELERSSASRLVYGVERFRQTLRPAYEEVLKKLAVEQTPHTLFITCSDSRINPNLITATDPGELFIVRNVGNIVPRNGSDGLPAEGAAVEFAVGVLGVREIVICGHSGCGAMKELAEQRLNSPEFATRYPSIAKWLNDMQELVSQMPPDAPIDSMSKRNVLHQVGRLMTYPLVREKVESGKLRIHAWFYDLGAAEIERWDEPTNQYITVGSSSGHGDIVLNLK